MLGFSETSFGCLIFSEDVAIFLFIESNACFTPSSCPNTFETFSETSGCVFTSACIDERSSISSGIVKGKVDFPQIGFEKGTTERGVSKVSKSC